MTGRRLASLFSLMLGVISFFLPLITISLPPLGNEMRWSGYTVTNGLIGVTSTNFYDIAAIVVYGNDDSVSSNEQSKMMPRAKEETHGASTPLISIIATGFSYAVLFTLGIIILIKYSTRITFWFSAAGFIATCIALISTFMLADQLQAPEVGSFAVQRGLVRIDVGYALYLLIAAFALSMIFQRLALLDRVLTSD